MADQVFVTDCLQNDSVKNQAGFGIRAASTEDPELLKFAAEFPTYELPLDMWASNPPPAQAPRRLAFAPAPRGTMALIHSVYVSEDTMGRRGNFFTHFIFYPASSLAAADALESWAAAEWQTAYPNGAPKVLPKLSDRPFAGRVIQPDLLTHFLAGKSLPRNGDLATLVCPPRLREDADPERGQKLLAKTLDGCLAAWNADAASARNRVYLVAEPGLVALLLYGVARLLPPQASANLSFSTFENVHRTLRHFRQVFACGTYVSDAQKSLDADSFKIKGFGFDTLVADRGSPELAGESSADARELVRLAAEGRWDVIRQWHECHVSGRVSAGSLRAARKTFAIFLKAKKGQLSAEELLEARRSSEGEALIQKYPDVFWPLILDFSMKNEFVRKEFADTIRKHADELAADTGRLLAALDPKWSSPWSLVKAVEAKERRAPLWLLALDQAARQDPSKAYHARLRVPLLQEWQKISPAQEEIPEAIREFLLLTSAQQFEHLQKAGLPSEWLALSLDMALAGSPPATWVTEAVKTVPDKLFPALAQRLNASRAPEALVKKLQLLVPDQESYPILIRLLKNRLTVPPHAIRAMLDTLGDAEADLAPIWYCDDHVEVLLRSLNAKEGSEPVWYRFCRFLTKDLLFGDAGQRTLFDNLNAAREKAKAAAPAQCVKLLDDWSLLLEVLHNARACTASKEEIDAACERRGLPNSEELLREFFVRVFQKKLDDKRIKAFAVTFELVYPAGENDDQQLGRFDSWLKLIDGLPETKNAALQKSYLQHRIPAEFLPKILKARAHVIDQGVYAELAETMEQENSRPNKADELIPTAAFASKPHKNRKSGRGMQMYVNIVLAALLGLLVGGGALFIGAFANVAKLPRADLDDEIARHRESIHKLERESADSARAKSRLQKEFDGLKKKLKDDEASSSSATKEIKSLKADLQRLQTALKTETTDKKALAAKLRNSETAHKTALGDLKKQIAELAKLKPALLEIPKFLDAPEDYIIKTFTDKKITDKKALTLSFHQPADYFALKFDDDTRGLKISHPGKKGGKNSEVFLTILLLKSLKSDEGIDLVLRTPKKGSDEDFDKAMKHLEEGAELVVRNQKQIEQRFRFARKKEP